MVKISKEESKKIRQMNKRKGRPENTSLISAGAGKSALAEYVVWNNQNRNASKIFNQWKKETDENKKKELKELVTQVLTDNLQNAQDDIFRLSALIDAYEEIYAFGNTKDILESLKEKVEERMSVLNNAEKYYKMTIKNLNR